jgi:transposase-like protein
MGRVHVSAKHLDFKRGSHPMSNSTRSAKKRGVIGTYHNVSKKYLPLYLNEFQFRHNNRKNPDIFGAAVRGC